MFNLLHKICGAAHAQGASVQHMRVDHGGAHILMAQQLLNRTDVLAPFQKVRCKGVAKGMAAGSFAHASISHRLFHGSLHHGGVEVVSSLGPCCAIQPAFLLGKHPLPGQLPDPPGATAESLIDAAEDQPSGSGAAM